MNFRKILIYSWLYFLVVYFSFNLNKLTFIRESEFKKLSISKYL